MLWTNKGETVFFVFFFLQVTARVCTKEHRNSTNTAQSWTALFRAFISHQQRSAYLTKGIPHLDKPFGQTGQTLMVSTVVERVFVIVITFCFQVALIRRQRRDLSVSDSNCHMPTCLPHPNFQGNKRFFTGGTSQNK